MLSLTRSKIKNEGVNHSDAGRPRSLSWGCKRRFSLQPRAWEARQLRTTSAKALQAQGRPSPTSLSEFSLSTSTGTKRRSAVAAKIVLGRDEIERPGNSKTGKLLNRMPALSVRASTDPVRLPSPSSACRSTRSRFTPLPMGILRQVSHASYSHDNLVPTLLGAIGVPTRAYRGELDWLARARLVQPKIRTVSRPCSVRARDGDGSGCDQD